MTTTELLVGGAIVLVVGRQLRGAFLDQWHAHRPPSRRDLGRGLAQVAAGVVPGTALGAVGAVLTGDGPRGTSPGTRTGWGARARWGVSVGARLAFLVWLHDVTDGAALSPFGWVQDVVGGTVWRPALVVLGLTEAVVRVGAIALRGVTGRGADGRVAGPAKPV